MKTKLTTLFTLLLMSSFPSFAEVYFKYEDKVIADNATLVIKTASESSEINLPMFNTESNEIQNVYLSRVDEEGEGKADINMCVTSCTFNNKTEQFNIPANGSQAFHLEYTPTEFTTPFAVKSTLSMIKGIGTLRTLKLEYHYDPNGEESVTVVDAGSVEGLTADSYGVRLSGNTLYVNNVKAGQRVNVYAITGQAVASYVVAADGNAQFTTDLSKGLYIVSVAENGAAKFSGKVIAE